MTDAVEAAREELWRQPWWLAYDAIADRGWSPYLPGSVQDELARKKRTEREVQRVETDAAIRADERAKVQAQYAGLLEAAREVMAHTRYSSEPWFPILARMCIELEDEPELSEWHCMTDAVGAAHEHAMTIVREETHKIAPVEGVSRKTFIYPTCGGKNGCGAVFMDGLWFSNPERELLYASDGREGR